MYRGAKVAVVVPTYRASDSIVGVVDSLPEWVDQIIVVDDACPQGSVDRLAELDSVGTLTIVRHEENRGVGAATISGYYQALEADCEIVVKIDSDGQMDPALMHRFIDPIVSGEADYCKGNRFFRPESLTGMPPVRIIGNAGLSFLSKMSSGYWDLMDPTNGYTAIHSNILRALPLDKLADRFFFESDLLFRLSTIRAVVADVPMDSRYSDEVSNLSAVDSLIRFLLMHLNRTGKRIFYNYFLRNFSVASLLLVFGVMFCGYGLISGGLTYLSNQASGQETPTGTILIVTIFILVGVQMLLAFVSHDISNRPQVIVHDKCSIGANR